MISKSLSTSEKRARLLEVAGWVPSPEIAEFVQQLFPLLVVHADDFGRMQGDVYTVMHVIDPGSRRSADDFSRALQFLHDVQMIAWYEVSARKFIQIINFDEHQSGLHKRTVSKFPEFPGSSRNFREIPGQEKRREQNRTELKKELPADAGEDEHHDDHAGADTDRVPPAVRDRARATAARPRGRRRGVEGPDQGSRVHHRLPDAAVRDRLPGDERGGTRGGEARAFQGERAAADAASDRERAEAMRRRAAGQPTEIENPKRIHPGERAAEIPADVVDHMRMLKATLGSSHTDLQSATGTHGRARGTRRGVHGDGVATTKGPRS